MNDLFKDTAEFSLNTLAHAIRESKMDDKLKDEWTAEIREKLGDKAADYFSSLFDWKVVLKDEQDA